MAAPFLPDPDDLDPHTVDVGTELHSLEADPDDQRSLREAIAGLDPESERWRIRNDSDAEWAMGRLARERARLNTLRRQRREYEERIGAWFRRSAREAAEAEAFFEAHLAIYAQHVRSASGGETKTFRVPSGEVATRKQGPARPTIVDADEVGAWAWKHVPQLVTVIHKISVADLRTVVKADDDGNLTAVHPGTGEVLPTPPGVGVERTEAGATVRPHEID